jgi:hypothetical protein
VARRVLVPVWVTAWVWVPMGLGVGVKALVALRAQPVAVRQVQPLRSVHQSAKGRA